jgi:hypothetical protein
VKCFIAAFVVSDHLKAPDLNTVLAALLGGAGFGLGEVVEVH